MATSSISSSTASTSTSTLFNTTSGASTATSANTAAATSAQDELDQISKEIERIASEMKKSGPIGDVQEFQKNTNDVKIDNNMTARDIGILRENDTRISLFSSLGEGDKVDVFKLRVATTGLTTIGSLVSDQEQKDALRIQVFSRSSGALIADNDLDAGDARKNYLLLTQGALELKQGDYAVRVSRADGYDPQAQKSMQYAIQFTQGGYKRDFDTVEKGVNTSADAFGFTGLGVGTNALISGLSSASSFISSLPAIGTSATSKLTGVLFDSLS
ncbi:hypothetical protein [Dongia sp.]|uniref:hypothetical protein n=1 Tax=Dongia sp. TaxID=1977262 RepID=UPI0035B259B6